MFICLTSWSNTQRIKYCASRFILESSVCNKTQFIERKIKVKRYGDLYEKVYEIDNLRQAFKGAKRGKGFYFEVIEMEKDLDKWLYKIQDMLKSKTYRTSEYEMFTKQCGKKERIIYKLPFYPDRVVHWAIINVVEPYFLDKLNECTHSAIPDRGIHSALRQLDKYMDTSSVENIYSSEYCLKLDVRKYYPSIPHNKLKHMYRTIFKDPDLLWLIDEIIDSGGDIDSSEAHPNLEAFNLNENEIGIPIGNYLSQYSGNIYLYKFDRWIKEELRVGRYVRYMDDIVILHNDKVYLHELHLKIKEYLENNLQLLIKDDRQVFPSRVRGVDFVGYRHFGNYILLRKSISKKLIKTMRDINTKIGKGKPFTYNDYCSINSYKGWLKWCNGHNLYIKWIKPLEPYAKEYYEQEIKGNKNKTKGGILIEKI